MSIYCILDGALITREKGSWVVSLEDRISELHAETSGAGRAEQDHSIPQNPSQKCYANSCDVCAHGLWISSANLSWKKLENSAYFTFRVNGNKIPQWMSADVFDTNSHFPICCLIEHDEWLESEKRRDKWQHLGSIACPIDSPSLLLLQPSWLLCPPHKPFLGGGIASWKPNLWRRGVWRFLTIAKPRV